MRGSVGCHGARFGPCLEYLPMADGVAVGASPVVLLAAFDLHGAVELFEEDDPGEGVG
jgi:hypothetical protein